MAEVNDSAQGGLPSADGLADQLEQATQQAEGQADDVQASEGDQVDSGDVSSDDVVDLNALDEFVFQGQKFTPDELQKSFLLHKDYTKKTQQVAEERKELEKNYRFLHNMYADLHKVQQDPRLVEAFKETYPEDFHVFLSFVKHPQSNEKKQNQTISEDLDSLPEPLKERLNDLESKFKEQDKRNYEERVAAEGAKLDAIFANYGKKFDMADPDAVMIKAERLILANESDPNFDITEKHWEKLFRDDHTMREKAFEARQKKLLDEQVKRGERAADTGPGGVPVGRESKRMSFDEATEMAIQDLGGR